MTDAQIIAIGITVLAVLAGTLFNNVRISDLNGTVNARLGSVEGRISSLETRFENRFNSIESRLGSMESRAENRYGSIDRKLDEILRIVGHHETRISVLEQHPR